MVFANPAIETWYVAVRRTSTGTRAKARWQARRVAGEERRRWEDQRGVVLLLKVQAWSVSRDVPRPPSRMRI